MKALALSLLLLSSNSLFANDVHLGGVNCRVAEHGWDQYVRYHFGSYDYPNFNYKAYVVEREIVGEGESFVTKQESDVAHRSVRVWRDDSDAFVISVRLRFGLGGFLRFFIDSRHYGQDKDKFVFATGLYRRDNRPNAPIETVVCSGSVWNF